MTRSLLAARRVALTVAALCAVRADTQAAPPPAIDVPVNVYSAGNQARNAVAIDTDDNFVVVWESQGQDGYGYGVFARRFDGAGQPLGPEFLVNSYTTEDQRNPAIAMRSSGEFIVVWQSLRQDGSFGGIFGRLFDPAGGALGGEFQVNSYTTHVQRDPYVAVDPSGRFVVTWQGYRPGARQWDVWARTFDAAANAANEEFVVHSYTTGAQYGGSVGMDGGGNFVVVWTNQSGYTFSGRVFARQFDSSGAAAGPDFPVFAATTAPQSGVVAVSPSGSFVVTGPDSPSSYNRAISAQLFDSSGAPAAPQIRVDTGSASQAGDRFTLQNTLSPSVAMDEAGNFVIAWRRNTYQYLDEDYYGFYDHHVRVRRYDSGGNPVGLASVANTDWHPTASRGNPSVAATRTGRFVVAWDAVDSSASGVFARSPDVIFTDAFETGDRFAWSSSGTGVAVTSSAKMGRSPADGYGLAVSVNSQENRLVQDDTPAAEPRYRARFYLDPNGFDPGESVGHFRQTVFLALSETPVKRLVLLMLRRIGGQYAIGVQVRRDDDRSPSRPSSSSPTDPTPSRSTGRRPRRRAPTMAASRCGSTGRRWSPSPASTTTSARWTSCAWARSA